MRKNQAVRLWAAAASIIAILGGQVAPVFALRPDDPLVDQWGYDQANVYAAWDMATGSRDVVVAVIDNGFDLYHPDLYQNTWRNDREIPDNNIDDDRNGYVDDYWGWNFAIEDVDRDGVISDTESMGNNDPRPSIVVGGVADPALNEAVNHGTLVAGIIGAVGNNGEEGAGINWYARLMNVKVAGNGGVGDIRNLDKAIRYAVDNGAHVINMSLVSDEKPGLVEAVDYAYQRGVVVVAAVGNDRMFLNQSPRFPACADQGSDVQKVLGVSAVGVTRHFAQFSNYGSCVDITAPGIDVSSTMRYAPQYGLNQKYGGGWQGTSFAAPFITGAAALIKSVRPDLPPKDIYNIILSSYRKPPPTDPTERKEYQMLFGAGFIQIDKAVKTTLAIPRTYGGITRIDFLSPSIGTASLDPRTGSTSVTTPPIALPANILDIVGYGTDKQRYTAVASKNKKNITITVFSPHDVPDASFRVPYTNSVLLTMADVDGDHVPEVIVAPRGRSNEQYRVYSLGGTLVSTRKDTKAHTHVFLGSSQTPDGTDEIVLGDRDNNRVTIRTFVGTQIAWVLETRLSYRAPLIVHADIDGDGVSNFVVAGGAGDSPTVSYLGSEGQVDHEVLAYDSAYQSGLRLSAADIDQDGQIDIITVPVKSGYPVRVWNKFGKKIAEWQPFGNASFTQLWAFTVAPAASTLSSH